MNKFSNIGLFFSLILLSSCASKIGYPGATRSKSDLSLIYFSGEQGVSISAMQVDQHTLGSFDSGIEVLPGKHSISLTVRVPQELCWLGNDNDCPVISRTFRCKIDAHTKAGKVYEVEARGYGTQASVWVIRKEDYLLVASKGCQQDKRRLF